MPAPAGSTIYFYDHGKLSITCLCPKETEKLATRIREIRRRRRQLRRMETPPQTGVMQGLEVEFALCVTFAFRHRSHLFI